VGAAVAASAEGLGCQGSPGCGAAGAAGEAAAAPRRLWGFNLPFSFGDSGSEVSFDCNDGLSTWRVGWNTAKISWCCEYWSETNSWPASRPSYCCDVQHIGCSTAAVPLPAAQQRPTAPASPQGATPQASQPGGEDIDCTSGLDQWRQSWTASRMSSCCRRWDSTGSWPQTIPEYCCMIEQVGCDQKGHPNEGPSGHSGEPHSGEPHTGGGYHPPKAMPGPTGPTTTNILTSGQHYTCEDHDKDWQTKWPTKKQDYCCAWWGRAKGWSELHAGDSRQEYCCLIHGYGCPVGLIVSTSTHTETTSTHTTSTVTTSTTLQRHFNCQDGLLHWRTSWSMPKQEFCCLSVGFGCPPGIVPTSTSTLTTTLTTTVTETVTTTTTTEAPTTTTTAGVPPLPAVVVPSPVVPVLPNTPALPSIPSLPSSPGLASPGLPGAQGVAASTAASTAPPVVTDLPGRPSVPSEPGDMFDCQAGWQHWKEWWSMKKQVWCCQYKRVGCQPNPAVTVEYSRLETGAPEVNTPGFSGRATAAAGFVCGLFVAVAFVAVRTARTQEPRDSNAIARLQECGVPILEEGGGVTGLLQ